MQNKHQKSGGSSGIFPFVPVFLAVTLLLSWQEAGTSAESAPARETTTELIINQPYEDRLSFLFRNYFEPSTYFISVKSKVSMPEVPEQPSADRVRLPGLPVTLHDGLSAISMHQALDNFFLGAARGQHMIRSNEITIWVDKDYDDASLAFMRKLANTALLVHPERGDRVRILRHEFPLREKEKDVVFVYFPDDVTALIKQDHMFDVYVQKPSFWSRTPLHNLIAIALIIVLLILLGIILYYYRKKQQEEAEHMEVEAEDEAIDDEKIDD